METIEVFLSTSQLRKFEAKQAFQLSAAQLQQGTGKHHVEIHLLPVHYKKLLRNVQSNKGFRFTPAIVQGGSLRSFGRSLRRGFKRFSRGVSKVAHQAGHALEVGAKNVVKYVPKEAVKDLANSAIIAGTTYIGQPELAPIAPD